MVLERGGAEGARRGGGLGIQHPAHSLQLGAFRDAPPPRARLIVYSSAVGFVTVTDVVTVIAASPIISCAVVKHPCCWD